MFATAAPDAVQASTASQTSNAPPSGMLQQPQGISAEGPSMGAPDGQPAKSYGRGSAQPLSSYGDNAQPPMYSSNPIPGMGSSASGGAYPMYTLNALQPEHAEGINGPEAHETSNGMQAFESNSPAVAQPEQSHPTQSSSAGTDASANSAAGCDIQQEAPHGSAAEMLREAQLHEVSAAADGLDKAVDAARDATVNVVHQSEFDEAAFSGAIDLEDELIEPQTFAGGQSMSHKLLAD